MNKKILRRKWSLIISVSLPCAVYVALFLQALAGVAYASSYGYESPFKRMQILDREALQAFKKGDYAGAASKWHEALEIAGDNNYREKYILLSNLGFANAWLGNHKEAIRFHEEALEGFEEPADVVPMEKSLVQLGYLYKLTGDLEKSVNYLKKTLQMARKSGNAENLDYALRTLGEIYSEKGDVGQSVKYFEEWLNQAKAYGSKLKVASGYANLGRAYGAAGDYEKAITNFEKALPLFEEEGDAESSGQVKKYLEDAYGKVGRTRAAKKDKPRPKSEVKGNKAWRDLFDRGVADLQRGRMKEAVANLSRALEIARRGNETVHIADTQSVLGVAYVAAGNFEKAIESLEEALRIHRERDNKRMIATDLQNIGLSFANAGMEERATACLKEAADLMRQLGDKYAQRSIASNLSYAFLRFGKYSRALHHQREALGISRELGDKRLLAEDLKDLGTGYINFSDYQNALANLEESLKIYTELNDAYGVGSVQASLGLVYEALGDYRRAIALYEESLKVDRSESTLSNLGVAYSKIGDYRKAISYYEQALKMNREKGKVGDTSTMLVNLGVEYRKLGDYQKALSYYKEALRIRREHKRVSWGIEADMADIYLELGRMEEAEKEFRRIGNTTWLGRFYLVKKDYKTAIDYFNSTLDAHLQSRNSEHLFAAFVGIGDAHMGLKNPADALKYYEKAVTLSEQQRESLGENERAMFFATQLFGFNRTEPYEGMVAALLETGRREEAFFYSEGLKARVLIEAISRGNRTKIAGIPEKYRDDERKYIKEIRNIRKNMDKLYRSKNMDSFYKKEKELKKAKQRQEEFLDKLSATYPEYVSVNYPRPIKSSALRLQRKELLIEFEVTKDRTFVFYVDSGGIRVRTVSMPRKKLKELVLKYRDYFEGIESYKDLLNFDPKAGKKLYSILFGKDLDGLSPETSIVFVPDEFLGILPFEALAYGLPRKETVGEGKYGPFPLGVKYLGDRFRISYSQSGTSFAMLRSLRKGKEAGSGALVVCDPIFSIADSRVGKRPGVPSEESQTAMAAAVGWKQMGVARVRKRSGTAGPPAGKEMFPRLPKTALIGEGFKNLFGGDVTVLSGADAAEEKICGLDMRKYRYVAFATHGILDGAVPWINEPALVLTQLGNKKGYDGFLTMNEVMGLRMSADVVALTACQSGVGENIMGEGVMGMGRAFQYAGNKSVMMSLWSVAEDASVFLSNSYYGHLKKGNEPKEAMRLARDDMRRNGYEHPFYWASFILVSR